MGVAPHRWAPITATARGIGIHLEGRMTDAEPRSDRARLEALRDLLEAVLNDAETAPRDLAAVSREYRQIVAALAQSAPAAGTSKLDEIAARRRKRGA